IDFASKSHKYNQQFVRYILVHPNECKQYIHLLLIAAKQFDKSNVINYCL
ncbi:unnamed protein product, partial [Rotaria sp. Silwood1]